MGYFPLCIDLSGKTVILVGGGDQVRDKAEKLRPFHPRMIFLDNVTTVDLEDRPACVIVGDRPRSQAAAIAELCTDWNIPVNVVDMPELCTFFFPSIIQRGELTVSVSTGGKIPAVSSCLRRQIEREIPDRIEEIMDSLSNFRLRMKRCYPTAEYRMALKEAASIAFAKNRPLTDAEFDCLMELNSGEMEPSSYSFYAVKKGKTTGMFTSWDECKAAVGGFSSPDYKGFRTKEEAEAYLAGENIYLSQR